MVFIVFKCNHLTFSPPKNEKINDSILECIGNTPLVRLSRMAEKYGVEAEIVAKCEFMNPSGCMKDRTARRMVLDAEAEGKIPDSKLLFEATSGNTGAALGAVCAIKGYKLACVIKDKVQIDKENILKALGID